jgi:putative oxidoreductase
MARMIVTVFYVRRQWRIMMDTELLLLRGTVGPLMVGHGAGKLFGAFNAGYRIEGTAGFLESIGFRPGKPWAYLHGAAELGAGAGISAGLLTPWRARR